MRTHRKTDHIAQTVKVSHEEIKIFEEPENGQVADQADDQKEFPSLDIIRGEDLQATEIIEGCREKDQRREPPIPGRVKDITRGKKHPVLPLVLKFQIQPVDYDEKYEELK